MDKLLKYEGIFIIDDKSIKLLEENEKRHFEIVNDIIHCTFKYRPKDNETFDEIVGCEYELKVVGYGNDSSNSGFEIIFPDDLKKYYINYVDEENKKLKIPHITMSISKDGEASNTMYLDFKKLDNPFFIKGKFGYWIKEDNKEFVSFSKFK